jgi:hypothetical protein
MGNDAMISHDELEAIKFILEIATWYNDEGPPGEGWQSEELVGSIALVNDLVSRLERE